MIKELEKEGVHVLSQKDFLSEIYPKKGVLTHRKPSPKELEDIKFGFPIASNSALPNKSRRPIRRYSLFLNFLRIYKISLLGKLS